MAALAPACAELDAPEVPEVAAALAVCGGSLQAASNAAPQDSVLEICAGTYSERLVINGKRIELRGVSGAAVTTINAGGSGRALDVQNVAGAGVRVTGLTLRNGHTSTVGRPARSGGAVADLGAASIGQVVEYDVSAMVTGDGVYTFALVPTSSSGFAVSSRESSSPPQLILTQ